MASVPFNAKCAALRNAKRVTRILSESAFRTTRFAFRIIGFAALCIAASFGFARAARAATLSVSPGSGTYSVAQTFTVNVLVSSSDQPMNAAQGVIAFPKDLLEVTGVSKSGTKMSLWVQEPSFSNAAGTVRFEGIVLNPGYQGGAAKVLSISFKVKGAGSASVTFSSGTVLANDGKGTNILSGLGGAKFTLQAAGTVPETPSTKEEVKGAPSTPTLSSETHPKQDQWYQDHAPRVVWPLPRDVTDVSLAFDQRVDTNPGTGSDGLFSARTFSDTGDGIWYVHVRLKNAQGWSGTGHFRIQIDSTPPSHFTIQPAPEQDLTNPKMRLLFDAVDALSGIDHYDVQVDAEPSEIWTDDGKHIFETASLVPGTHKVTARAVDKAGNALTAFLNFDIASIVPPTFTDYPKELQSGDVLVARGIAVPNSTVTVWLQRDGEEPQSQQVHVDAEGHFRFISSERVFAGSYTLWAQVTDAHGLSSSPSESVHVRVDAAVRGVSMTLFIIVVTLNLLLLLVVAYLLYKYDHLRGRVRKGLGTVQRTLHEHFDVLRDDLQKQIQLLEHARTRRALTTEEERLMKNLKKGLTTAEQIVRKALEEIHKEVFK